jgi:hypothetical protein
MSFKVIMKVLYPLCPHININRVQMGTTAGRKRRSVPQLGVIEYFGSQKRLRQLMAVAPHQFGRFVIDVLSFYRPITSQ